MAPLSSKALSIIEKFQAPAALWIPSSIAGEGWSEISGIRRGGQVIIQVQEDALDARKQIAVVRFDLRHGQDVLNGRILHGLPLNRVDEKTVDFKCASTSTRNVRHKTINRVQFQTVDDTDDFVMWWYAKNGSIKEWLGESSMQKARGREKRKATEHIVSLEKRSKMEDPETNAPTDNGIFKRKKRSIEALVESTNVDRKTVVMFKKNEIVQANTDGFSQSEENSGSNLQLESMAKENSEEREKVMIDYDDAPQSQNWSVSFDEYE